MHNATETSRHRNIATGYVQRPTQTGHDTQRGCMGIKMSTHTQSRSHKQVVRALRRREGGWFGVSVRDAVSVPLHAAGHEMEG